MGLRGAGNDAKTGQEPITAPVCSPWSSALLSKRARTRSSSRQICLAVVWMLWTRHCWTPSRLSILFAKSSQRHMRIAGKFMAH